MLQGQLYINGTDAWKEWGIFIDSNSLSALMTPPATKDYLSNESRLEHGTRYYTSNVKMKERDVTLSLQFVASSESDFLSKYASFCEVLQGGTLDVKTKFQPNVVYHCLYVSCTQYSEFNHTMAKFSLKLREPNPTNRTA